MFRLLKSLAAAAALLVSAGNVVGAQSVIGNWSGSGRSWNHTSISTLRTAMINEGHTVVADAAMTAANLSSYNFFVIGEATLTPGATELSDLLAWVSGGGRLGVFFDSGASGNPGGNAILSYLGTGMSVSNGSGTYGGPLVSGTFVTEGPPHNIVGMPLNETPASPVSGGNEISGSLVRYAQVGSGFVFAFGDRLDHNFNSTSGSVNERMFLNMVGGVPNTVVPEPATVLLTAGGMLVLAAVARRKRRTA